jgi:hypothetical protein
MPHRVLLRLLFVVFVGATSSVLTPALAAAQGNESVKDLLRNLFDTSPTPAEIAGGTAAEVLANAARFPEETAGLIALGVSTLPAASSSAGFTYALDPVTGGYALKTDSFGALMADRPLTSGRRVVSFAFNYQRTRFASLNGIDVADHDQNSIDEGLFILDNGVVFADGFRQFITDRAYFSATSTAVNLFLNYGVTNQVDLGLVVPVLSMSATGRRQRFWDVTRSFQEDPDELIKDFPEGPVGERDQIARTTVSASGIGDLAIRAKFAPVQSRAGGVGLLVDFRLPTGDDENLLGAGEASARFVGLVSTAVSNATLSGTFGYATGGLSDSLTYSATVDVPVGPQQQVTLAATVTGQRIQDGIVLERFRTLDSLSGSGNRTTFDRQIVGDEPVTTVDLSVGAKVHLTGNWLLGGAILVPLNDAAFRGGVTPIIGLDYTWSRAQ